MKNKIFKKALSLFCAALLAFAAIPLAFAAEEYSESGATKFVFSDESIAAEKGSFTDYKIEKTALSIKGGGTYILSGNCSNGCVTVKKGVKDVVLVLDGITLASADTAPLTCAKSSAVKIVAKSGTVNTFTDSELNNDDSHPENENAENAVFKFKDGSNVELCGEGTINVVSKGKNGIKAGASTETEGEASLTVRDLTLNISTAVNDGINAEAALNIKSGSVTVSAADDGIHSDLALNIGESGTDGPTIKITESYEGLEGANITVYSGDVEVHSTDDGINAANSDLENYDFSMTFAGGKTVVYADDGDGVDSNGSLTVSGGTLAVFTGNKADNQPLDADGTISINGGTVFAAGSSGGMGTKIKGTQPYVQFGSSRMGGMPSFGGGAGRPEKPGSKSSSEKIGSGLEIKKGETLSIKDSQGNVLFGAQAPYDISTVIFSSSELKQGENYTLFSGSNAVETKSCGSSDCSCLCHKSGIASYIWKIVLFFSELFGINQNCSCGATHY